MNVKGTWEIAHRLCASVPCAVLACTRIATSWARSGTYPRKASVKIRVVRDSYFKPNCWICLARTGQKSYFCSVSFSQSFAPGPIQLRRNGHDITGPAGKARFGQAPDEMLSLGKNGSGCHVRYFDVFRTLLAMFRCYGMLPAAILLFSI